jgi:hypothetical protein
MYPLIESGSGNKSCHSFCMAQVAPGTKKYSTTSTTTVVLLLVLVPKKRGSSQKSKTNICSRVRACLYDRKQDKNAFIYIYIYIYKV